MAVAILVVEMVMVILVAAVVDWMIKGVDALVMMIALPIVIVIVIVIVTATALRGILMMTIGVVIEAGVIVVTAMTTVVLLRQIVITGGAVAVKDLDPGPGIASMVMVEEVEGEAGGLIVLGPHLLVGMVTGTHTQTPSVGIITILKVCLWAMLPFPFKEGI